MLDILTDQSILITISLVILYIRIVGGIMALVNDGYESTWVLGSKNDKTRVVRVNWDATVTTYDEAVTATTAYQTDLLAVSAGVVKSRRIGAKAVEDAYNRPADADAEWRDTAQVTVSLADNPTKTANLLIPMPKIGIFQAAAGVNMDVIDTADADLLAFVDNYKTGAAMLSDGEKADVILSGKRLS